jgi:hypothetical protein
METFFIPTETEFKKWVKEAIAEYFEEGKAKEKINSVDEEPLLSRKEIAKKLRISLVTLNDWKRRGLPSHKQRGRVYFLYSEVIDYIKRKNIKQVKFSPRYIDTTA